ncbi:MAG: aminoacetone oxidase family FAD-binding enzyme [Phycisphaerales bacterium]|nr:aminoacetone oxidase family FAD-binding enzyme [Phycisphaerales bacterium]
MSDEPVDIAIVGAGAAGLFAAIWAAREVSGLKILAMDGARTLGAKILVAGGGRCNVTHCQVGSSDYCGSDPELVQRILRCFTVDSTIAFFEECGVTLKQEDTGKLFPTTDRARTVLDALLGEARRTGVELLHPQRVERITASGDGFIVEGGERSVRTHKIIVATGGMSLPKSGSDGQGLAMAQTLGHSITPRIDPALVPLTLAQGHWLTELSGVALFAEIVAFAHGGAVARDGRGKPVPPLRGALLCTHFGLSGPAALDISRHWLQLQAVDPTAGIRINWLPGTRPQELERELVRTKGQSVLAFFRTRIPDRFLRAACAQIGVDPVDGIQQLTRHHRGALVRAITECEVVPTGTRGFTAAETTAGGVPLSELNLDRLESLRCPGLFLCGEMLDVDARIGGFSFQWAWASGFVAGRAAARAVAGVTK